MSAPTLEAVVAAAVGGAYPTNVLDRCESALILFAAAFWGRQDAVFVEQAGILDVTCVDVDAGRLREMRRIYPGSWEFIEADAFEYAESAERMWDVVSVDCPTGAFDMCAEQAGAWCSVATVAVVLGTGLDAIVRAPDGWRETRRMERSGFRGGVWWTVLEPV